MECEYHSGRAGPSCFEDDRLEIDRCGSSERQRFITSKNGKKIMPQANPELCLTRNGDNVVLKPCAHSDPNQLWEGMLEDQEFQLYQGSITGDADYGLTEEYRWSARNEVEGYCLGLDTIYPQEQIAVYGMDCAASRNFQTGTWELDGIEGDRAADLSPTESPTEFPTESPTSSPTESGCGACIDLWSGDELIAQNLKPISTWEDIEDFYGYEGKEDIADSAYLCTLDTMSANALYTLPIAESDADYSFNSHKIVKLVEDYSLVFIHEDESDCQLSLVIVHDSRDDYSGGRLVMYLDGDWEESVVHDGRDSPSDSFIYNKSTGETKASWEWSWQSGKKYRTDGIADYWDPDKRECRYIRPEFKDGIDRWQFVPGPIPEEDGHTDPDDYITLNKEKTLWVCKCGAGV